MPTSIFLCLFCALILVSFCILIRNATLLRFLNAASNPSEFRNQHKREAQSLSFMLAAKEGFEPSRPFAEPTPLAGEPLTATWVLLHIMAEREGFEPPVPCGITGFQDRLHKPLGHLSLIATKELYQTVFRLSSKKSRKFIYNRRERCETRLARKNRIDDVFDTVYTEYTVSPRYAAAEHKSYE